MENTTLKAIVVDDSGLQRLSVIKLVKDHPNLEFFAEFNNALKTKECLQNNTIDLVFLDIEMPILSGFDLLNKLENKPAVIFVTGKTQYAFEAFNYEAIDYLQKPVTKLRFDVAVQKALQLYSLKHEKDDLEEQDYIFVKSNFKKHKVALNSIRYVEAYGDYVKVITDKEQYTVLSTMKGFDKELPSEQFLRVHKSYIVNLDRVIDYSSKYINIGNGNELPLSRNRKQDLEEALAAISVKSVGEMN